MKTNLRGFLSETTESNERLKIWLAFANMIIAATAIAKLSAVY